MGIKSLSDGICVVCKSQTQIVVNINLRMVHVCDDCCNTITKQNVMEKGGKLSGDKKMNKEDEIIQDAIFTLTGKSVQPKQGEKDEN